MAKMRAQFQKFLQNKLKSPQRSQLINGNQISVQNLSLILHSIILSQYENNPIFANDFFKEILLQNASIIMSVVYSNKLTYMQIRHIVATISLTQHILYHPSIQLPTCINNKIHKYVGWLLNQQPLQSIRSIRQEMVASHISQQFYQNIYQASYTSRTNYLLKQLGIFIKNMSFPLLLLKNLIQQKQSALENYRGQPTAQWVMLCLAFFVLNVKFDEFKQKPVLEKLLEAHRSLNFQDSFVIKIDAGQLIEFHNKVIIEILRKLDSFSLQKMLQEIQMDHYLASKLVVTPILSENNTVLDNIVFSSSFSPSLNIF